MTAGALLFVGVVVILTAFIFTPYVAPPWCCE
jgi:hypothetical protein